MTFLEFEQTIKSKFPNKICDQISDAALGLIYITTDYDIGYCPYTDEWWIVDLFKTYTGKTFEEVIYKNRK